MAAVCQGGVLVDESGAVGAPGWRLRGQAHPATNELCCRPDLLGYEDHPAGKDDMADAGPLLGQHAGGGDPGAARDHKLEKMG